MAHIVENDVDRTDKIPQNFVSNESQLFRAKPIKKNLTLFNIKNKLDGSRRTLRVVETGDVFHKYDTKEIDELLEVINKEINIKMEGR